jgi:hypothetical protein
VYLVISVVECEGVGALWFVVLVLYRLDAEGLEVADFERHAVLVLVNVVREG